jgi:outer membrane biogenesis lipoprotein LolB
LNRICDWRLAMFACAFLTGCSGMSSVQPWEKGTLAKPEMTFEGDVLDNNFTEHTYFSKEGASGGGGVGGGGCGCN